MAGETAKFETKVKAEWIDDATAAAWRKWHPQSLRFWHELNEALFSAAQLAPGQRVLDLASGAGDPALAVARRVAPNGHVVVTDLAPQMIDIARDHAAAAGLTNVSFELVDAHAMPFADGSFDRVTCRLGVMYFWDCPRALAEIRRVLRPGGVATFIAWGRVEENEFARTAIGPFKKRNPPPEPAPGAPTPYRFGPPGTLEAELRGAKFSGVTEETRTVGLNWPGSPEELWTRLYEISAPMRPYFDSFAPGIRAEAIQEVVAGFAKFSRGREISMRTTIILAAAFK